jgi:hypothetical protein
MTSPKARKPSERAVLRKVAKGVKLAGEEPAVYAAYVNRLKARNESDLNRWSSDQVFPANWNARTSVMAAKLPAKVKSVADFGCGAMALRDSLAEGVAYVPVDIVPRGEDTIVIDLNAPVLPPLPKADAAFFSGTLEYVIDLPRLIETVCAMYPYVACSYVTAPMTQTDCERRRSFGWVTDFRLSEIIALFEAHHFIVLKLDRWHRQSLLLLQHEASE